MNIRLLPRQLSFDCEISENLYEGASRAGIRIPISCKNGVCEYCEGVLRSGRCKDRYTGQEYAQPGQKILLCNVMPLTDCEVEMANVLDKGEWPLQSVVCQIVSVSALNQDVFRVQLRLPAGKKIGFTAGQYLSIDLPGREPAFFSIASSPEALLAAGRERLIELHIQAAPEWESAWGVISALRENPSVKISLPMGKSGIMAPLSSPLILIAAGTGFAQMKGIVEHLIHHQHAHPVHLYWGVRKASDLYWRDLALAWQQQYHWFNYAEVIGDVDDNAWPGHHEQLFRRVLQDAHDLKGCQVIASGSPAMVYATLDALVAEGLAPAGFHSDVLEYAPRA
ncbi:MAG: 2Fe-2S iron-sulfur cluster binding domain-containing protein [Hahellaceae bacterium]|nr:2Fe-2S iron-sulfur cluster binding domain-containing protein [Hahellaceae bacterium]MCP5168332.1 2Fe-2S iron-sulfur cluster binding domain-containing protein [Hahellaceae bacterium]